MTPFEWIMRVLDAVGSEPRGKVPRQCPAHRDAAPSLSMHLRGGRLMLFCHAGCGWREILRALGCTGKVLHEAPSTDPQRWVDILGDRAPSFPDLDTAGGHPAASGYRLEAVHDYQGWLLERWRHPVTQGKDLRWWTKRDGTTIPGLLGTPMHELPLYRENEVKAARLMGETVILVESESSVDALKGWAATTWAGGAACVPVRAVERVLGDGAGVVLIPDMDAAGLECAKGLMATLPAMRLLVGNIGEDAKDLYTRVGADSFREMVRQV